MDKERDKSRLVPSIAWSLLSLYNIQCILLSACLCVHACLCLEIVFSFSKERVVQTVSRGVWAKRLLGGFGSYPPPVALPVQIISICENTLNISLVVSVFLYFCIYNCRLRTSY